MEIHIQVHFQLHQKYTKLLLYYHSTNCQVPSTVPGSGGKPTIMLLVPDNILFSSLFPLIIFGIIM